MNKGIKDPIKKKAKEVEEKRGRSKSERAQEKKPRTDLHTRTLQHDEIVHHRGGNSSKQQEKLMQNCIDTYPKWNTNETTE